jgi:hypothetical protein
VGIGRPGLSLSQPAAATRKEAPGVSALARQSCICRGGWRDLTNAAGPRLAEPVGLRLSPAASSILGRVRE